MTEDKILESILNRVENWLKFAEAKNAGLIVLSTTLFVGYMQFFLYTPENSLRIYINDINIVQLYVTLALCFFALSIVTAMLSFVPKTDRILIKKNSEVSENDNLIFFGEIANFEVKDYLKNLLGESVDFSRLQRSYADQIIHNSKIANHKYSFFGKALWFTISGLLTPVGGILIYLLWKGYFINFFK